MTNAYSFRFTETIYDGRQVRGPRLMATLRNAGHMEPVDGIGAQFWTPYIVAWFKSYLYSDKRAATLFWGSSSPFALMQSPQISAHSDPGMDIELRRSATTDYDGDRASDEVALSAFVTNTLSSETQYEMFYHPGEQSGDSNPFKSATFHPSITPRIGNGQTASFTFHAVLAHFPTPLEVHLICMDTRGNGTTFATVKTLIL